jgi:hypothetical protein
VGLLCVTVGIRKKEEQQSTKHYTNNPSYLQFVDASRCIVCASGKARTIRDEVNKNAQPKRLVMLADQGDCTKLHITHTIPRLESSRPKQNRPVKKTLRTLGCSVTCSQDCSPQHNLHFI